MQIADLLSADRVVLDQTLASKKSLLEKAAKLLARAPEATQSRDIFEGLCQRERLGSTGLGHGVAIPHCRVPQTAATGAFVRLRQPIDFDSPDSGKVDLFFALAVPSECTDLHLKLLASIAESFSHPDQRERLRRVETYEGLIELLGTNPVDPAG
ncbi:MAG: PTS sugar transporter subunit IIA [Wenzhouxiangellaceae bacterium]|nr:PTS sugar transporter subunit IIA [Wenzhouxiangellaceae bacterium]